MKVRSQTLGNNIITQEKLNEQYGILLITNDTLKII